MDVNMETISTTVNDLILTVGMITTAVIINRNNGNKTGNTDISRFPKPSVSLPGPFTGNTQDWKTWKEQSLSKFGMLGLSKTLKEKEHATQNPGNNETVYFMLQTSIVGGNASATFVGKGIDHDRHLAWATLIIECDGRGQSVPEAHKIRAELDGLRLDTMSNGQTCNNEFKECVSRLQDFKEANSESVCIEKYLAHVTHPDYDQWKEMLKSTDDNSLENCYKKVSRKATEVSNNQLGKREVSTTPRNARVRFEIPVELDVPNTVNIVDYVQDNG